MKIASAGNTDTGKARKNNEDAFLVDDGAALYAVADGIGGHEGGEVASRMAIEVLRETLEDAAEKDGTSANSAVSNLVNAFQLANAKIREASSRDAHLSGMGTTLTALLLTGKTAHLAHVGDSRCYLLRGSLEQVTEDHGVVAEQVRAGLITPDQARKSPYRHIITRALGIDEELLVDTTAVEVEENDVFLLCTDGLTEMVEDQLIMRILASSARPSEAVGRLISTANDHGGADNVTVVVVKMEKTGAGREEHG